MPALRRGGAQSRRLIGARRRRRRGVERLRQAEVEHLHGAVRRDLDVGRLQVAVDDAVLVRRFERFGDLARDAKRFVERDRSAAQPLARVFALDELHDQGEPARRLRGRRRRRCSDG